MQSGDVDTWPAKTKRMDRITKHLRALQGYDIASVKNSF